MIDKNSVNAKLGAKVQNPKDGSDKGRVMKLDALAEVAFFFNNPTAWYVHLGTDQKPVTAKLVRLSDDPAASYLFDAYAYLMLHHYGISMGAGASFGFSKSYKVVSLEAGAQIDWAAKVSWGAPPQAGGGARPQMGASIALAGYARVKVLKLGLGLSLAAALSGEGPQPFVIAGSLTVKIETKLKDFEFTIEFIWRFNEQRDLSEVRLLDLTDPAGKPPAQAVCAATDERFPVAFAEGRAAAVTALDSNRTAYIVPIDSRIDIEFAKPVNSAAARVSATSGAANTENFPPQPGEYAQVEHTYSVTNVEMFIRDGGQWVRFDPYDANVPAGTTATTPPKDRLIGHWQYSSPKKFTKLSILAQTPLEFLSSGANPQSPEAWGFEAHDMLCAPTPLVRHCAYLDPALDTLGTQYDDDDSLLRRKLTMHVDEGTGSVLGLPGPGHDRGFAVWGPEGEATFVFPEAVTAVDFLCATLIDQAVIEYQETIEGALVTVASESFGVAESPRRFQYSDPQRPITRIRVSFEGDGGGDPSVLDSYLDKVIESTATESDGETDRDRGW